MLDALLRFGGALLALGVLFTPFGAFYATALLLEGSQGSKPYFEAVAQIIPLLIVAMVIEVRYLSPRDQLVEMLAGAYGLRWFAEAYSVVYSVLTFLLVIFSEVIALSELARGKATELGLMFTAGGLAAGGVALVVSVLFPAEDERAE